MLQLSIAKAVTCIIAPHGMTDYIHAKKFGYLEELYKINLSMITGCLLLNRCNIYHITQTCFLFASVIHFRNDMPLILNKKALQLAFSAIFVGSLHFLPSEYLVLYMIFVHVPNHYRLAWNYVKDNLEETIFLIVSIGAILSKINRIDNVAQDVLAFVQTVVISHIIYQEKYVFPEYTKLVENLKQRKIK
jgi:hypothetical protein